MLRAPARCEETEAGYAWLDHYVRDGAARESALPAAGFTFPTPASRRSEPADLWTMPRYPGSDGAAVPTSASRSPPRPEGCCTRPEASRRRWSPFPVCQPSASTVSSYQIAALPGLSTYFETDPAPRSVTVAGSPTMTLTLTSDQPTVTLFASLWRVSGEQATLPASLVAPIRVPVTPGRPTTVTVSLPAATYEMPSGSRWRVLLTSTEATYANSREPARIAVEAGADLTVPVVEATPVGTSIAGTDTEIGARGGMLAALVVLAGVAALWRRRQRRHEEPRPDLADVPLVVTDLVKSYADGHRAVDGVSWRAEKGQVVGLLGPERRRQDDDDADGHGPHRRGLRHGPRPRPPRCPPAPTSSNGWARSSRGRASSAPDRTPEPRGLLGRDRPATGGGAHRRGARGGRARRSRRPAGALLQPRHEAAARHRPGHARAPELLVLDEPTNGLDPPQIAAMRPILRRYAETGRTVVISSHMLAEVEMTCTHVVVMHAGRVVTQGLVADLVDSDDTTILDLDPVAVEADEDSDEPSLPSRLAALRAVDGIIEVRRDTETRVVVMAERPRVEVVGRPSRRGCRSSA